LIEYEGGSKGKGWSKDELASISNLFNMYSEQGGPSISTKIIVEQFGGVNGLISGLNSNAETGIPESEVQ